MTASTDTTLRILSAVARGQVRHAHPAAWGREADMLDVRDASFARVERERLIKVLANAEGYWRPVIVTDKGKEFFAKHKEQTP